MQTPRLQFLILATMFQGGLAILALCLGWLTRVNPFLKFDLSAHSILQGCAATIPMLIMFAFTYRFPVGPLKTIKQFLIDALGPLLAVSRWYDLVWVALLAGTSEELLFRGVIQGWFNPSATVVGLFVSNVAFGLAHAVTPTYAILASLMGMYLGGIHEFLGNQNLVVPIVTHTLYDLVAFIVVRHDFQKSQKFTIEETDNSPRSSENSLSP